MAMFCTLRSAVARGEPGSVRMLSAVHFDLRFRVDFRGDIFARECASCVFGGSE